jgi:D-alanyl-D-alanine carboxypeptidase/D-alanyl-D-alanine-endopeptidase (penicillin-binding protein 4)
MNKFSNNLMSRHIFLTLGAERYGAPGTVEKARRTIGEWLVERLGHDAGIFVDNGAGLSRRIRLTAAAVGQLLEAAHKSPLMPEFMSSLAIIGIDGTMRRRLRDTPLAGRGHIKTGSIDNVSSLAGYVVDRTGRRWIVVLMINPQGINWRGGSVQDAFLQWIYETGAE